MFIELLKRITGHLETNHIEYMVSGSLALNVYSIPRMTMDIDIVIELNDSNLVSFLEIFHEGYYLDPDTMREEIKRQGMFNVIDHLSGLKVDFIVRKNTDYRRLEFSRRKMLIITGIPVWIVSPEDLIISKLEWIQRINSDKQRQDIISLIDLPSLDKEYISGWCSKLKLNTFDLI